MTEIIPNRKKYRHVLLTPHESLSFLKMEKVREQISGIISNPDNQAGVLQWLQEDFNPIILMCQGLENMILNDWLDYYWFISKRFFI